MIVLGLLTQTVILFKDLYVAFCKLHIEGTTSICLGTASETA